MTTTTATTTTARSLTARRRTRPDRTASSKHAVQTYAAQSAGTAPSPATQNETDERIGIARNISTERCRRAIGVLGQRGGDGLLARVEGTWRMGFEMGL